MNTNSGRPNVVFVNCHDLGTHLGCYGWDVETPHIDEMARNGVRFENAFCTAPQCSPSRSSIATGAYPHKHGMMGLAHRGWALHDESTALPWQMNDAGYATHLFGFQHETDWSHPERLGYEGIHRDDDGQGHPPARALTVADQFADCLGDLTDGDAPFFVTLGFVEPHLEFRREYVPESAYERYDPGGISPLPYLDFETGAERRDHLEKLADFWSLITATVDPAVGQVRETLRAHGLEENTVIVFTTDHGEPFYRAKTTCYDTGIHVSLLVEGPGGFDPETRRSELLSIMDLCATFLDLANTSVPAEIESRSVLPLLEGLEYVPRDRVYCEQTWHEECLPVRAVRTHRYKYLRRFPPYESLRQFPPYAGREFGSGDRVSRETFYNLDTDPHERTNLVDPAGGVPDDHRDAFENLRADLKQWMTETGDPLVEGYIPLPQSERIDRTES